MSQDFKITSKRNKLSVRYQYIIFPFSTGELLKNLARTNFGYVLAPPPKAVNPPIGATLDWSGIVAKKGNISLYFDSLSQILGVEGATSDECINVFSEVLDIIKTTEPEIDNHAFFYELISNYTIETGKSPLQTMGKIKPEGKIYDTISEMFQIPIATYSLHLFSLGEKIESTSWFDFKIQPVTTKSAKVYDVMVVYRDKEKSKVDKFFTNLEENVRKTFVEIEK